MTTILIVDGTKTKLYVFKWFNLQIKVKSFI